MGLGWVGVGLGSPLPSQRRPAARRVCRHARQRREVGGGLGWGWGGLGWGWVGLGWGWVGVGWEGWAVAPSASELLPLA